MRDTLRVRTRLIAAVVFATGISGALPASAADPSSDARNVIQSMWESVSPVLADKGMDRASREARFVVIYRSTFDNAGIAAIVTGSAWLQATPAQREQFLSLFETYVTKVYAGQFANYNGERLLVLRSEPDSDGAIVTSQIGAQDQPAKQIELRWRLRRTASGLKVRDVIVENISMTLNQRREFAAVLRQRGGTLEGLMTALREKIAEIDRKN